MPRDCWGWAASDGVDSPLWSRTEKKRSQQGGASEWVNSASERANQLVSDPVLQSRFLVDLAHSQSKSKRCAKLCSPLWPLGHTLHALHALCTCCSSVLSRTRLRLRTTAMRPICLRCSSSWRQETILGRSVFSLDGSVILVSVGNLRLPGKTKCHSFPSFFLCHFLSLFLSFLFSFFLFFFLSFFLSFMSFFFSFFFSFFLYISAVFVPLLFLFS